MKNKLKLILALIFVLTSVNSSFAMEFVDVPQGFWAYEQIDTLTNENVIGGYPENYFMPQNLVTRAEYASMVIKVLGQDKIPIETMYSFEDIDNSHWAFGSVVRAVNLDILKPADDGYFYPNDYVTRSEVITFLVNILKTEDITKKEAITALQNAYLDFDDVPDWFKVTAGKAEVINVIAKEPPRENYLDYDRYITRAQMAVFLFNLKRETDMYMQQEALAEISPKIAEGIIVENVFQDGDIVTLPAQTVLPIVVSGQISSDKSVPGEMFQAHFVNNIVNYEHHLLFSKDVVLIGKILDTTRSKNFVRNGELIFELSAANNDNFLTKIFAVAHCEAPKIESNKFKKVTKSIIKGRNYVIKDGQILYVKLYKPVRINIVTGEVLD
ncbi:S-layer homology domain-containing protein [bacterium]|nr:S-layer homology domain-containing protein [bacterium]